jgi:TonB family protein
MRHSILFCLLTFLLARACRSETSTSDWRSAPKPKFPVVALKRWSEGSVKLRIVLAKDGTVAAAAISKSSGDSTLDEVARKAVLKWRMNPSAIRPDYLTNGREQVIEFRQEAWAGALYRDRTAAAFSNPATAKLFMYAPFPAYPLSARERREEGRVLLKVRIHEDGSVAEVQILQSSGYADLDDAAAGAVRHWRARKTFAGKTLGLPINFTMRRR